MVTIVVFASSLFLTSILVLAKAIELKYNKRSFLLRLIGKLDQKAEAAINRLKFLCLLLIQSVRYLVLIRLPMILKEWAMDVKTKIMAEYRAKESVVMGRKNITNKGSVSFYLKKIDQGYKNGQGKIVEDNLEFEK